MSPWSSLLRRAAVTLLAVAAATTSCAPARAATATLTYYGQTGSPNSISESVKCTIEDDSTWKVAEYHVQQLAQNGYSDSYAVGVNHAGPGYYYEGGNFSNLPSGTYDCWVICSGPDYYNNTWYASTGGTDYYTL